MAAKSQKFEGKHPTWNMQWRRHSWHSSHAFRNTFEKNPSYFVVRWWCSSKGWRKWMEMVSYFDLFCPLVLVLVFAPEKYILAPSARPNWWKRNLFSCVLPWQALWLFTSQFAFVAFVGAGLVCCRSLCDLQTWWGAVSFLRFATTRSPQNLPASHPTGQSLYCPAWLASSCFNDPPWSLRHVSSSILYCPPWLSLHCLYGTCRQAESASGPRHQIPPAPQ